MLNYTPILCLAPVISTQILRKNRLISHLEGFRITATSPILTHIREEYSHRHPSNGGRIEIFSLFYLKFYIIFGLTRHFLLQSGRYLRKLPPQAPHFPTVSPLPHVCQEARNYHPCEQRLESLNRRWSHRSDVER